MMTQSSRREQVDGVLLLDKPRGLTSNDALMRARRLFNARKAGHGGTLDPMASGLLPVAFGEATKFAAHALEADKTYLAELTLGLRTATGDAESEVTDRHPVSVDRTRLTQVLCEFTGPIEQVPPMHSALKRDGRPLYAYAREGIELERPARRVQIHAIELIAIEPVEDIDPGEPGSLRVRLRVTCSKGTYVRTLAEDIGEALGCGAYLSALRRERVGELSVDDALTLDQLEAIAPHARRTRLAPTDFLLSNLPMIRITPEHAARMLQGQRLRVESCAEREAVAGGSEKQAVRVYCGESLLGLATLSDGLLVAQRLVSTLPRTRDGSVSPTSPEESKP